MLFNSILETVGRTPLVRLGKISPPDGSTIYAKVESFNPLHSVKDRTALAMIQAAETNGTLRPWMRVVEPTSGNTGIGLAMVCANKGYPLVLTMPESMSMERRKLLKALGSEIVLTPATEGMEGAIRKARFICSQEGNCFMPSQFDNPANPEVHYRTTAKEILDDLPDIGMLVAGVGTGGTITGIGRALKEKDKRIWVVGVEPATSAVLGFGRAGTHRIQGIGAGFVPKVFDRQVVDWILPVTDEEAFSSARRLAKEEGILAGISSGAALSAALSMSKGSEGRKIVVILPDSGERYLSTELFEG